MFHAGDGWATVDDMMEQGYTSNGLANSIIAQWKNPEFDKLVAQAEATQDLGQAKSLYLKAQQIILDQEPVLTTGAQYSVVAVTPKLQGFFGRADNSNRALITSTLG